MDYALGDFLMFTSEVYLRLFVRLNETLGLWLACVVIAGVAAVILLGSGRSVTRSVAIVIVAGGWMLTAALFMARLYAPINWPVSGFAWAFALEALLLAAAGWRLPAAAPNTLALALALVALMAFSTLTALAAGTAAAVALPGITPDMTALASVVLIALFPRAWRWPLLIVPLLWCAFSALTHQALALWLPMAVPVAALALGPVVALWPSRGAARPSQSM